MPNRSQSRSQSNRLHISAIALQVGGIAACALALWLGNHQTLLQSGDADFDEGINLMKAYLVNQGLPLYTTIWNDQPPLFTMLLAQLFQVFGNSVIAARSLVLGFASLLVWSVVNLVRTAVGWPAAIASGIILMTTWKFGHLSTAVMIGLPSIALAVLSVWMVRCYHKSAQIYWLVLSGITFALSLQTKLFTGFLLPFILLEIIEFKIQFISSRIRLLLLWLGSSVIVFGAIALGFQQFSGGQLLLGHLAQPREKDWFDNVSFLRYMLRENAGYALLALVGIGRIVQTRNRSGLFPLSWFISAIVVLANQKPLWYHHYALIAIPMSWLSGYAIAGVTDWVQSWVQTRRFPVRTVQWGIASLAGAIIWIYAVSAATTYPLFIPPPPQNTELIQQLITFKPKTQWILCDRPFYAFQSGLKVPPELAVMSFKRLKSGQLTLPQIHQVLQTYRPEQIALIRWTKTLAADRSIWSYIQTHYTRTYQSPDELEQHYVRKDIR